MGDTALAPTGMLIITQIFLVGITYLTGMFFMSSVNWRRWFDKLDWTGVPTSGWFYGLIWFILYGLQVVSRIVACSREMNEGFRNDDGTYEDIFSIIYILFTVESLFNILWAPTFFVLEREYSSAVILFIDWALVVTQLIICAATERWLLFAFAAVYVIWLTTAFIFNLMAIPSMDRLRKENKWLFNSHAWTKKFGLVP